MDDLISRKAAIEAIMDADVCVTWNGVISDDDAVDIAIKSTKGSVISSIVNMPSAQPDSKELSFTHKALDTISRQDAIRIVDGIDTWQAGWRGDAIESMKALPTAQPETHEEHTETHACDCISRQAAVEAVRELYIQSPKISNDIVYDMAIDQAHDALVNLPSAQPEQTNSWCINSWCIDCKEYDTENKCCPRYNRVIKQTLDDAYRHGETEAEARFYAEIVRCKDCIFHGLCRTSTRWAVAPKDDWYCADAERRIDEQTV